MSVIVCCKVVPKAKESQIMGWEGDVLKVRLAAVPEKGKANDELVRLLAKALHLPRSSVKVVSGATCRLKRVAIDGLDETALRHKLNC